MTDIEKMTRDELRALSVSHYERRVLDKAQYFATLAISAPYERAKPEPTPIAKPSFKVGDRVVYQGNTVGLQDMVGVVTGDVFKTLVKFDHAGTWALDPQEFEVAPEPVRPQEGVDRVNYREGQPVHYAGSNSRLRGREGIVMGATDEGIVRVVWKNYGIQHVPIHEIFPL